MLNWTRQFGTFCFLDNHQYQIEPHSLECLLGAGVRNSVHMPAGHALQSLQVFIDDIINSGGPTARRWLFGHLGYDLKNEIEGLQSSHPDPVGFPDLFFFEPEIVIRLNEHEMQIEGVDPGKIAEDILSTSTKSGSINQKTDVQARLSKEEYCAIIERLRQHILRGDCYEINFCQEFYSQNASLDPYEVYKKLSAISPNPFSALYKLNDQWLICASPERFLKKQGNTILSQPIKGTSSRVVENESLDEQNKVRLKQSSKDRSENVMVVDLVRNDLARVAKEGTVKVDELFGIYSFPQVHQMISTVSGILREEASIEEIIRATFPMGSMTGAPKKRVMELIEVYEKTKRGIFSGALGYISPELDFDFNVVIRSIMYNAATKYLSFQAGSGITFYSEPEKEWEECLVKAAAIKKVLE